MACHQPSPDVENPPPDVRNRWIKGWRSIFLFGVTIVLVVLGVVFCHASAAGEENPYLETQPPQLISVFSTDPNANISLTAQLDWQRGGNPLETLYVSVTGPKVNSSLGLLISVQQNGWSLPYPFKNAIWYSNVKPFNIPATGGYVAKLTLKDIEQKGALAPPYGYLIATVSLPLITQESRGSFLAHLPDIGAGWIPGFLFPDLISLRGSPAQSEKLIWAPVAKNPSIMPSVDDQIPASQYQAPPGQHPEQVYWQPASLTTTEILEDAVPPARWGAGQAVRV